MFPREKDTLDLTRCVVYALQPEHVYEQWYFPDHYHTLVERLGGPAQVMDENLDRATYNRWWSARRREMSVSLFRRERDPKTGRLLKEKVEEEVEENDEADAMPSESSRPLSCKRAKC